MTATLGPRPLRLSGGVLGAALAAGLAFAGWAALASFHVASSASVAKAMPVSEHAKVCKCAHCPGEALCCCGKAGAPNICPE